MSLAQKEIQRIQAIGVSILAFLGIVFVLYYLKVILVPFVVAVFLALLLNDAIKFQIQKFHFPRFLAVLSTFVFIFLIFFILAEILFSSFGEFSIQMSSYKSQINIVIETFPFERFGLERGDHLALLKHFPFQSIEIFMFSFINFFLNSISYIALVLIFVLFMLLSTAKKKRSDFLEQIDVQIKNYLFAMGFVSFLTGLLVAMSLWMLGIPFAILIGFLAFLLNFIPNLGSIIATLIPIPIIFLTPGISPLTMLLAIIIPATIQFVVGNIIAPKVQGSQLAMSPITVLLALMFWGLLWGLPGFFLGVPITACLKTNLLKKRFWTPLVSLYSHP